MNSVWVWVCVVVRKFSRRKPISKATKLKQMRWTIFVSSPDIAVLLWIEMPQRMCGVNPHGDSDRQKLFASKATWRHNQCECHNRLNVSKVYSVLRQFYLSSSFLVSNPIRIHSIIAITKTSFAPNEHTNTQDRSWMRKIRKSFENSPPTPFRYGPKMSEYRMPFRLNKINSTLSLCSNSLMRQ